MRFVVQSLTCWKNLISPLSSPLPHGFPNENHLRDTGEKKKSATVLSSNGREREREEERKERDSRDGSMNMHI